MEIAYVQKLDNNYFEDKNFTGFIGEITDLKNMVNHIQKINLKWNYCQRKKILKNKNALEILGINKYDLSNKKLSNSYQKLINLIKIVNLKPDLIILNNFDLGFNYKDKMKISKYIKIINASNHTNFIIISNDLLFMNKCVKHIIIAKNKIIKYQGDLLTAIKDNLLEKPEIIKFIDLANNKTKLDYTLDNKELLKAIYRSVF